MQQVFFFTDLWQLNGDRPRGGQGEGTRTRSTGCSYVASYDVSRNPNVGEGESMQFVKNNRHTLADHG
jgi:hypothetical protein